MTLRYTFSLSALALVAIMNAQEVYDATILQYRGLRYACDDMAVPVLRIQNTGTVSMASCVVETWKGGGLVQTFDWQLAVPAVPGETRQPALPALDNILEADELTFMIISVNEQPDEVAQGNVLTVVLDDVPVYASDHVLTLEVMTGAVQQDFTWQVLDEMAVVIASGGPYETTMTAHETVLILDPEQCYQVMITELGQAGIPNAHVALSSTVDGTLFQLPLDANDFHKGFVSGSTTGLNELSGMNGFTLAPNPTEGLVRVTSHMRSGTTAIDVIDATGRTISTHVLTSAETMELDLSTHGAGAYMVALTSGDGVRHTRRVIVY